MTLTLLLFAWIAWFAATPMSHQPLPVTEGVKSENPVLSVTASSGGLSLTATSEKRPTPDVMWTMIRKHPAGFKAVLFFGLALSLVRFVQQRLKYTKFVYRAYMVLTELRGPSATSAPVQGHP